MQDKLMPVSAEDSNARSISGMPTAQHTLLELREHQLNVRSEPRPAGGTRPAPVEPEEGCRVSKKQRCDEGGVATKPTPDGIKKQHKSLQEAMQGSEMSPETAVCGVVSRAGNKRFATDEPEDGEGVEKAFLAMQARRRFWPCRNCDSGNMCRASDCPSGLCARESKVLQREQRERELLAKKEIPDRFREIA
jgi:hypothetical protein